MRQLRKRLEEYFATEGKSEPFTIVIPKAAYVPMFEPRTSEPLPPIVPAVATSKVERKPWTIWIQPAAIALLAIVCVWLLVTRDCAHWRNQIASWVALAVPIAMGSLGGVSFLALSPVIVYVSAPGFAAVLHGCGDV